MVSVMVMSTMMTMNKFQGVQRGWISLDQPEDVDENYWGGSDGDNDGADGGEDDVCENDGVADEDVDEDLCNGDPEVGDQ